MSAQSDPARVRGGLAILFGLCAIWMFHQIGVADFRNWTLDLGSVYEPQPRHMYMIAMWAFFGLGGALAITAGLIVAAPRLVDRLVRAHAAGSDRTWIVCGTLGALAIPLLVRAAVLHGAPVADDDSMYRFSAELLAHGHLWAHSPPGKGFFEHSFVINNGRYFTQYFLGWPALLAPFALLGVPWLANPVIAALAVPALFGAVRRLAGSPAARLAVVIYVLAPIFMIGAATELSNTSSTAALIVLLWAILKARDQGDRLWPHVAVGLAFTVTFFVRPLAAFAMGGPLLVWWLANALRLGGGARLRALAIVALIGACAIAVFLWINWELTGHPLQTGYGAAIAQARANGYRFTTFEPTSKGEVAWYGLPKAMTTVGFGLVRLNVAAFGWPTCFLVLWFAVREREMKPIWACFGCYLAVHLFVHDIGIDAFAPMHYFELAIPVLILTAVGAVSAAKLSALGAWRRAPALLVLVMSALALLGYLPVRVRSLDAQTEAYREVMAAPARAGVKNAIVFTDFPITPRCARIPTQNNILWWPLNDIDFRQSVLWANHLTLEQDRALLASFPGRRGYLIDWDDHCKPHVVDLATLAPGSVRPGVWAQ